MQRTAFLSVFGALVVAKSAGADAPDIIRAAASLDDDATPYLYAMAGGVFKKYGLDAHVERAASGAAVAASIVGGAFEVGKSSITSFTSAHAHGLPLIAVSPGGEFDINLPQSLGMFVRADGPVRTTPRRLPCWQSSPASMRRTPPGYRRPYASICRSSKCTSTCWRSI